MDSKDQPDAGAEIHLRVYSTTQQDSQVHESDFNQDTTCTACGDSHGGQRYCSDNNELLQNITVHDEQLEARQEHGVCKQPTGNAHLKAGLETVKSEEELNGQEHVLQFNNTGQLKMTHSVNELVEVKQGTIDINECGRDGEETRCWLVCADGVLKEVKAEHTQGVSESFSSELCSQNVDQKQYSNKQIKKIVRNVLLRKMSSVKMQQLTSSNEKPYIFCTPGKSLKSLSSLKCHEKSHICAACGKSLFNKTCNNS